MKEQPQHYELALIIPGAIAEDQHQAILKEVKDLLNQNQAQITQEVDLGRKKLAYAIKQLKHGFYFVLEMDLLPRNLKNVEKALRLNNHILRFITIKKKVKTAEDIAREEKSRVARVKEQLQKDEVEPAKPEKSFRPKVSLEDLDKKLDELLEKDVI